jgi:hypothetical protein
VRFKAIATPMLARGIPVIPLRPNSKSPLGVGAPGASKSLAQIEEWDAHTPNANCASVATPDGCWFLDVDAVAFVDHLLADAGQIAMPHTFTVATSRGLHFYFKQDDASRAMGNVAIPGKGEARVSNYYVVSPGSVHPSGGTYAVRQNCDIVAAPAWLIEHLSSHKARATNVTPRTENLDAVESSLEWLRTWTSNNNVTIHGSPVPYQGGWKIYTPCPNAPAHTSDSGPTEAAILIGSDGKYGFRCHHSHCGGVDWQQVKTKHEPTEEDLRAKLAAAFPGPTKLTKAELRKRGEWCFPRRTLYGPLGRLALEIEVPLGFGYPALITAFAGRGVPERGGVRTTMYCALIADVFSGKSEAITRACNALGAQREERTPSSDRGLERILKGVDGANVLLTQDELKSLFGKADIQNSTLAATLCSLWSRNRAGAVDKTGGDGIHARLSILGAIPVSKRSDFRRIFSAETRAGLYSRFVFGCLDKREVYTYKPPKEELLESLRAVAVDVPSHCHEQVHAWVREMEATYKNRYGRMGEMLLRVAVILASANGETELSEGAFAAARVFCEWQIRIQSYYVPSNAANEGGEIHEAILEMLRSVQPHAVSRRSLLSDIRASLGVSGAEVLREFKAMVESQSFEYDKELGRCWLTPKKEVGA